VRKGQVSQEQTVRVDSSDFSEVDSSDTHESGFSEFQEVEPVDLTIIPTVTHQIRSDVQSLSKFLSDDFPVQVLNSYFLETATKLHKDSGNCGRERQVNLELLFQFWPTSRGKRDAGCLEKVSHIWKPLFLLLYDSLALNTLLMLDCLEF
jgi:hypothetical protein